MVLLTSLQQLHGGWWLNKGKGSNVAPPPASLQLSTASAPSHGGTSVVLWVREEEGGRRLRDTSASTTIGGCRGREPADGAANNNISRGGCGATKAAKEVVAQREESVRMFRHKRTRGGSTRKVQPNWFSLDLGSTSTSTRNSSKVRMMMRRRRSGGRSGGSGSSGSGSSGRMRSAAPSAAVLLRGGEASLASTPSPIDTKGGSKGDSKGDSKGGGGGGGDKEDGSWGINLNVFGWGADSEAEAEARAAKKRKAQQDMEESEAREAMRKAREER